MINMQILVLWIGNKEKQQLTQGALGKMLCFGQYLHVVIYLFVGIERQTLERFSMAE